MFFIGQNLKHVHMIYSFLELLIFFWLTLDTYYLEFISDLTNEVLYGNKSFMENQPWNKNNHFQKPVFFNVKWKLLMNKSKFFSVSSTCFQRSSRSQMLFKIRALENFAIPELKRDSTQVFSCKKQPLGGARFWKLIDVKVCILKNRSIPQSSALSDETRTV